MTRRSAALEYYCQARDWLISSDYYLETLELASANPETVDESQLLREHAWVVLNAGFREALVRVRFDFISLCFCDWESAAEIVRAGPACVSTAMAIFRNQRKLTAILDAAKFIDAEGFAKFFADVQAGPAIALARLPHIGEVTALHLAKNLGFNVVKPDRHLVRLAKNFGYPRVDSMCTELAQATGDQETIVDLVLWRFQERMFSHDANAKISK